MNRPTPCEQCDHVHMETRKQSPSRWMCVKFPRLEGMSPVAPTQFAALEPYNRCVSVNLGYCPLWSPRRDGQLELGTRGK
jgi:hypothetical protein